jgi:signal transduction histidine kinase
LLRIALPAYEGLYALVSSPECAPEAYDILAEILQCVGVSQLHQGLTAEAKKSFEKCYDCIQKVRALDTSWKHDYYASIYLFNTAISYSERDDYASAEKWINYAEAITKDMANKKNVPALVTDMSWSTYYINRATICIGLGKQKEADQAFAEFKRTYFAKTNSMAKIYEGDYMLRSKRYAQSADAYAIVYQYLKDFGSEPTLQNLGYLTRKFEANYKAGRNDSALSVAAYTFEHLDSAIAIEKKNQAIELSTIYQTQQKDAEIAQQKNQLLQTRVLALLIALVLAATFFTIYAVIRRRQRIRLEEKNQQLMIANERAEESSRMKTKFIQQISHEIRTPLNILSGFTQVVTAEGMELDEAARHDANQQILENTDRITGLINKMLELSDASSRTVIQLTDQVSALQIANQAVLSSGIEEAAHLDFKLQDTDGAGQMALTTNQQAAVRVLSLLLDNAIKFTAPAEAYGHQAIADKKCATLTIAKCDGFAQFAVEDTGIGVPAAEAEHIFDEFVQLDEYYNGTGIGLTVARSLARRLGGNVVLDTTHTPGARFVFTLPTSR